MSKRKRGRELRLETIEPDRMDIPHPIRTYPIDKVGAGERVFVFVMEAEERRKISLLQLEQQAQVVGDLVFPHHAVFLVVQPGAKLSVYEVKEPCHPPVNGNTSNKTSG